MRQRHLCLLLCALAALAGPPALGDTIELINSYGSPVWLKVIPGGIRDREARIIYYLSESKVLKDLDEDSVIAVGKGESLWLEVAQEASGLPFAGKAGAAFALLDAKKRNLLGGPPLMFIYKGSGEPEPTRVGIAFLPPAKNPPPALAEVDRNGGPGRPQYEILAAEGTAAEGAGAGALGGAMPAVESKAAGAGVGAMDCTEDGEPEAAAATAWAGPAAKPARRFVKGARRLPARSEAKDDSDLARRIAEWPPKPAPAFREAHAGWVALLGRTSPPRDPDFRQATPGRPGISKAARARSEGKLVDGFDATVGPRLYGPGPGLFDQALDDAWLEDALAVIQESGMNRAWAAYYLEVGQDTLPKLGPAKKR